MAQVSKTKPIQPEPEEPKPRQKLQIQEKLPNKTIKSCINKGQKSGEVSCPVLLTNTVDNFEGGKIKYSVDYWKQFQLNKETYNIINGKSIEFSSVPRQYSLPRTFQMNKREEACLDDTIVEYLKMHIIEGCEEEVDSFYSNVFLKLKDDASARFLFDLRELNEHIVKEYFKSESIYDALNLIFPNAWFCKLDLKHAYFSIPIRRKDRKYLKFRWRKKFYQFTCLPQGLTSAARKFTKLMKVPIAHFRALGMTVVIYLDDLIFIAKSPEDLLKQIKYAMNILDKMGLTVNLKKSILTPKQIIDFIGFTLNSKNMTIKLTKKRRNNIIKLGTTLLNKSNCSIRLLASFIGHLVASEAAVPLAPLYYKHLEINKNESLKKHKGNFNAKIKIEQSLRPQIKWWITNVNKLYAKINKPSVNHHLFVDASLTGWGAVLGSPTTHGHWEEKELDHINIMELGSILLALKSLCKNLNDCHIKIHTDNTTALMCIQKRGSNLEKYLNLTKEIFDWTEKRGITLSATHVQGRENCADIESRRKNIDTEWMIRPHLFQYLIEEFGQPSVDLFASRINKQLPKYVSWFPDPEAMFTDAFSLHWNNEYYYAFPPFRLIGRVLRKIHEERSEVLAVLPVWPSATWFATALGLLCQSPRFFPRNALTLPQQPELQHRLYPSLRLAAWRLSGRPSKTKEFLMKCQNFSHVPGETPLSSSTHRISKNGWNFAYQGKLIHFSQL